MKVSELALRAGISGSAVRFYESAGILPVARRGPNGYREFADEDLCRIRLVVALRRLGLQLREAGRLAETCVDGRCDDMARDLTRLVAARRAEVAAQRAELDHLEAELVALEQALASGEPSPQLCLGKEV